jgi:thioredoxin 1
MIEEDRELERIKRAKLNELIGRISTKEEKTPKGDDKLSKMDKPIDLTDSTFTDFIKKNEVAVVDCWAPWCGPCRIVSPIIDTLAKEYSGKITFGKLNTDNNRNIPMQFGIMSIPTILVFKNGKLVDRIVGAMPKPMLENRITRYL